VYANNSHSGVSGLPSDAEQREAFGVLGEHERALVAELGEFATLRKENTDGSRRRPKGVLGIPEWYETRCERQSRAVWRGQLTELEARGELALWHRTMLATTGFKKPRRGTGTRSFRRIRMDYPHHGCPECGKQVEPFTGLCVACSAVAIGEGGEA
jgi:hypothetical protein